MTRFTAVDLPPTSGNPHYPSNRPPLQPSRLLKLPTNAFAPSGWVRKHLQLQRDGLTGHLGEISIWLVKEDNAWLNQEGKGKYGWEEVPYWLRGFARVGFALADADVRKEAEFWVEGTLASQRPNGDFGPVQNHRKGFRDLWAQMLMLQILQNWHECTGDERILPFMERYFRWQLSVPDDEFLEDYWENSRGGDNLESVLWLYNRTGTPFLLELAEKIHRNTANWRMEGALPNWHNVNITQCFREPASYWQVSGNPADLKATYRNFDFVREKYGEVPGGLFGADENARPGFDDPRQAVETCGMVEQLLSNNILMGITGDPKWIANSEDVAYNTLPAAFMPDYRALRYLVAPNMAISDAANHAPGIDNSGPFLLMNPFSSRCCQHNHTSAWVNYLEGTTWATQDRGIAVTTLAPGSVRIQVGQGEMVNLKTETRYPFEETARITFESETSEDFPLYLFVPDWAKGATIQIGDERTLAEPGRYMKIERTWSRGDQILVKFPMKPNLRVWDQMKNSVSVQRGPLTYSLKIEETHRKVDGAKNAQHDAGWQPGVDSSKWHTYEILPASEWNFGLDPKTKFTVQKRDWPLGDDPF